MSPKTVANVYGLFISSFRMFRKNFVLNVSLPTKQKPDTYTPTDAEVTALIKYMEKSSSDQELELAILLGALGPARRGEVCGITAGDISSAGVSISKSYVKNKNNEWIFKKIRRIMPDTAQSSIQSLS